MSKHSPICVLHVKQHDYWVLRLKAEKTSGPCYDQQKYLQLVGTNVSLNMYHLVFYPHPVDKMLMQTGHKPSVYHQGTPH